MTRRIGQGRVLLFPAPPLPSWTNLPLHPAFVALAHRTLAEVATHPDLHLNIAPGDTFQTPVSIDQLNRDIRLRSPATENRSIVIGRTELNGTQPQLRIQETNTTGAYSVYLGQDETPAFRFAVQSPPGESDLTPMTLADDLKKLPGNSPPPLLHIAASSEQTSILSRITERHLWTTLLILAALLSTAELTLGLRATRPN